MSTTIPEVKDLRPVGFDPKLVNSIGLHHSLPTALADLVDNSIDAHAGLIRVRILLDGTAPVGVQVIDDGDGMDSASVENAMTYAGTRDYRKTDLGHFGVGLKAASLSQADTVLIYSRAFGATPVGRKLFRSGPGTSPTVGTIDHSIAADHLDKAGVGVPLETGTIIEWRDVRGFPTTSDDADRNRWLQQTISEVRNHLGLVLNRILPDGGPELTVSSMDVKTGARGVAREVIPIDPFGYRRTGAPDFPQELRIELPDGSEPIRVRAHIWPPGAQEPGFKIAGQAGVNHQGCFIYRRDRLLQLGGWCGMWSDQPAFELARLEVDLTESAAAHVTINPEKSGIEFSSDLRRALEHATCVTTGHSLREYLDIASGENKRSRTRKKNPVTVVEPRFGLPAALLDGYRDAVEFRPDFAPVDIRWRPLEKDQVFTINLDLRELGLNLRYRHILVGSSSLNPEDAPILKTLIHLLTQKYFAGLQLGDLEKREIKAWQEILFAAVRAQELQQQSGGS